MNRIPEWHSRTQPPEPKEATLDEKRQALRAWFLDLDEAKKQTEFENILNEWLSEQAINSLYEERDIYD